MVKNGNKDSGIIKSFNKNHLNLDCMMKLYKTLIRPKLEYNSVVWNNLCITKINTIKIVKRKYISSTNDQCSILWNVASHSP